MKFTLSLLALGACVAAASAFTVGQSSQLSSSRSLGVQTAVNGRSSTSLQMSAATFAQEQISSNDVRVGRQSHLSILSSSWYWRISLLLSLDCRLFQELLPILQKDHKPPWSPQGRLQGFWTRWNGWWRWHPECFVGYDRTKECPKRFHQGRPPWR